MSGKIKFKSVEDYSNFFLELIELEREEEMNYHREEILKLSPEEREHAGRAITSLKAYYEGLILMKHIYLFRRKDNVALPETEIKVGDVVLVSCRHPLRDGILGTVVEKSKRRLKVAFESMLPLGWKNKPLRIDLFCNDVTFQRMKEALSAVKAGRSVFSTSVLLGMSAGKIRTHKHMKIKFFNRKLNESQRLAVVRALTTKPLFLIHGPPGTGKTTTCVEIVKQFAVRGARILVCADSNTAVDNLVERLADKVKLVRVGHPARVSRKIYEHFLDYIIECSAGKQTIDELSERIKELEEKRSRLKRPHPKLKRGLSDEQIMKLARIRRSLRGLSRETIEEMSLWIAYTRSISSLIKKKQQYLDRMAKKIVSDAQVVCTTNSASFSDILKDEIFDVVIIDEATQATEPSCLMPLVKAPIVIMAGDHKQLPPTVLNDKAKTKLSKSMFERFMQLYGKQASVMLTYQYRMHPKLMEFPNRLFYGNKLKADRSVSNISVSDLFRRFPTPNNKFESALIHNNPLLFIDIAGSSAERRKASSTSLENPYEALIVKKAVRYLLRCGVKKKDIGIITPYKDQVELLKCNLKNTDVEINTVDGFQGREKEIIILSMVRSNINRVIGFLKDERRLNVAITRARRKLIIIGDSKTLGSNLLYRGLIEHMKKSGLYLSITDIGIKD